MKKNIGTFDRLLRALIGIILVVVIIVVAMPLWAKIAFGAIALFSFYEALASWCLFYQLIGKNTCPME